MNAPENPNSLSRPNRSTLFCRDIRKSFGGTVALDNVSLDFPLQGIVGLIGPNGAGKSTLLNVISGFDRPDSGEILLGDFHLTDLAPHQIVGLGLARSFQDLRLVTRLSAMCNVLFARPAQRGERLLSAILSGATAHQEEANRAIAQRLLEAVGLLQHASTPVSALSYGQQKLLSIACCIATGASILLLDEPVAGVHPTLAEVILQLLKSLRNEGRLLIVVEHDLPFIRGVAEELIVMDNGRILLRGATQHVLDQAEVLKAFTG